MYDINVKNHSCITCKFFEILRFVEKILAIPKSYTSKSGKIIGLSLVNEEGKRTNFLALYSSMISTIYHQVLTRASYICTYVYINM